MSTHQWSPTLPHTSHWRLPMSQGKTPLLLQDLNLSSLPTCWNTHMFFGDLTYELFLLKYHTLSIESNISSVYIRRLHYLNGQKRVQSLDTSLQRHQWRHETWVMGRFRRIPRQVEDRVKQENTERVIEFLRVPKI